MNWSEDCAKSNKFFIDLETGIGSSCCDGIEMFWSRNHKSSGVIGGFAEHLQGRRQMLCNLVCLLVGVGATSAECFRLALTRDRLLLCHSKYSFTFWSVYSIVMIIASILLLEMTLSNLVSAGLFDRVCICYCCLHSILHQ